MAFGQEMQDFIAAFQVGTSIKQKKRQLALDTEQESNRAKEATNKAAAVESRFQRTQDYNQKGRDITNKRNAGIDARAEEQLNLNRGAQDRLAAKDADAAWAAQIAADPESGYDADGNIIPPPSQRGKPSEAVPTGPQGATNTSADDITINSATVADAIDGGLKRLSREGEVAGIQSVMEGAGAPHPQTVQAVDNIIDPDGKMSEDQKTLARLEATYKFYTTKYKGKDGIERANEAAAQWLQHARGVAAIQAHAAQVLNSKGDTAGAAKKLVEMHNSIPDGNHTTFDEATGMFTVTDGQTGEVIQEGQATPEMIDQIAASFTKGPEFFNIMMSAAMKSKNFNPGAGRSEKAKKPVTSKALKEEAPLAAADNEDEINDALFSIVGNELKDVDGAPIFANKEEFVKQVGEDSISALSDLAIMISGYNGIDAKKAAKLALVITNPDDMVGDPSEQQFDGFKVLPISKANQEAGIDIMVIQTPDGTRLNLPASKATVAITTANHGLFIAAKETTQNNMDETNRRVINDNADYNNDRTEAIRLRDENRAGLRTGRGSSTPAPDNKKRRFRGGALP